MSEPTLLEEIWENRTLVWLFTAFVIAVLFAFRPGSGKIHRDSAERGYSAEAIVDTILRRMPDYINHITPQFSRTDINFQRVSTVDTSNPFIARDIPTPDESFVVIRFKDPKKFDVNFPELLAMLQGSFMSRRNSIVVPGGKMGFAMEIVLAPIIERMMDSRG
jgi:phosphoribulokinase